MRLIDADALIMEIKMDIDDDGLTERMVFYRIKEAPTIEPEVDEVCGFYIEELIDIAKRLRDGDDLISRADAIDAIARLHALNDEGEIRRAYESNPHSTMTDFEDTLVSAFDAIYDIPSAQPKQGAWINKHEWANGFYERECSICGAMKPILMHTAKMNFCPNCGADMRQTEGSER